MQIVFNYLQKKKGHFPYSENSTLFPVVYKYYIFTIIQKSYFQPCTYIIRREHKHCICHSQLMRNSSKTSKTYI